MASRVTGFGACGTGIALLVAVLIGETASTSPNYWCGLWWPDTHPERTAKRAERDQQALFARYARRDALRELMDELEGNRRDVGIELVNKRTYGVSYPGTAWAKNQHVLDEPGLEETRKLVEDPYLRTHALNQQTAERYRSASENDVNDPEWLALTSEEAQEREQALDAVEKAKDATAALHKAADQ